tara:strand:- start:1896 stop:2147 length:252 start_codon:yes stop_codon:yes gene_type:complete
MPITSKQYIELKTEIEDIKASVDEIKKAIIGNPTFGQEGLADMVRRHEAYIYNDKKFKQRLVGAGAVLGTVWTLILKWGDLLF